MSIKTTIKYIFIIFIIFFSSVFLLVFADSLKHEMDLNKQKIAEKAE